VPGDTAVKIQQTKEPEQKNDFDEWLARIICYAFSVPPTWATKAMNRATADNQSAQAEDEGLEPTKEWVKDLVDQIITEEFASPDLELVWLAEEDNDLGKNEAALENRVKLGALTLNELRDALGLDPYTNAAADRPMVLTATGYVPIEAGVDGPTADGLAQAANVTQMSAFAGEASKEAKAEAKSGDRLAAYADLGKDYNPDQPRVPAGNADGGQWASEGAGNSADEAGNSADGADRSDVPDIQLAASGGLRCDGFSAGCQNGGSYGTTAMYNVFGRNLCMDCAVKVLGLENEPPSEKVLKLSPHLILGK
ncbi:MAG: hypothetical protein WB868_15135, partial [Xanthobacteraceae bacterium]